MGELILTSDIISPNQSFHDGAASTLGSISAVCAALENPENNQVCGWGGYRTGAGRKPKPPEIPPDPEGERWYCVCVLPGKDRAADIEARLAGFTIFAPTIFKPEIRPGRNAKGVFLPGMRSRIEPLFRRYFFARFDRTDFSWTKILHLPGNPVQRIISSTQGLPIAVPDIVIEAIQSRAHVNGCIYPTVRANARRLPQGTRVRLLAGAFVDHIGELAQMSDGKRVEVLLHIMGAQRPVKADQAAVEVVG